MAFSLSLLTETSTKERLIVSRKLGIVAVVDGGWWLWWSWWSWRSRGWTVRWWGWRSGDAWMPEIWDVEMPPEGSQMGSSASHVVSTVRANTSHIIGG